MGRALATARVRAARRLGAFAVHELRNPHERAWVDVGDTRIYCRVIGAGPPVVLLHGALLTGLVWAAQIDALSAAYRVIVPDLRGHGRSGIGRLAPRPSSIGAGPARDLEGPVEWPSGAGDYARYGEDIARVIDALAGGQAHVVGWSDGGIIGLTLALGSPDRCKSLSLMGAPFHVHNYGPRGRRQLRALAALSGPVMAAFAARRALCEGRAGPWSSHARHLRCMWRDAPRFTLADLARVGAPTLVLATQHDEFLSNHPNPLVVFETLDTHIPDARLVEIGGATHAIPLDSGRAVNEALIRFLAARR